MPISIASLRKLAAAGATAEMIIAAVEGQLADDEQKDVERRRKERERKQRYRLSLGQRGTERDGAGQNRSGRNSAKGEPQAVVWVPAGTEGSKIEQKESSPTPPKEKSFLPSSEDSFGFEEPEEERSTRWDFDAFWNLYPHKVGKIDARRAFDRIRKTKRVEFLDLMAGLRRYVAKTDDRPWCNPATWLNGGRWDDQPARAQPPPARGAPTNGAASLLAKRLQGAFHVQQTPDNQSEFEIIGGDHATGNGHAADA